MAELRQCLIHYESISTSEQLTTLSQNALETLIECRKFPEHLGGENRPVIPESYSRKLFQKDEREGILLSSKMLSKVYLRKDTVEGDTECQNTIQVT